MNRGSIQKVFTRNGNVTRITSTAVIAMLFGFTLSGCAAEKSTTTPKSSSSTTGTNTVEPEPTPTTNSMTIETQPIDITCDSVFGLERLYNYNPNLALLEGGTELANRIQELSDGIICDIVNTSSNELVQYKIVKLTQPSLTNVASQIASSSTGLRVSSNIAGRFDAGSADFIIGDYWVSVSSEGFVQPQDPEPWALFATQGF